MIRLQYGVYMWSWFSPEKRFNFNGHLLKTEKGVVAVDPVPLSAGDLAYMEAAGLKPDALVLTNRDHQRASEDLLARWKARVVAHAAETELAVPVDVRVQDGDDVLGLTVVHLPGKSPGEIALHWPQLRVLLVGDAIIAPYGMLKTVPQDKQDDPARLRRSIERLKDIDFDTLLVGDGDPLTGGAKRGVSETFW